MDEGCGVVVVFRWMRLQRWLIVGGSGWWRRKAESLVVGMGVAVGNGGDEQNYMTLTLVQKEMTFAWED